MIAELIYTIVLAVAFAMHEKYRIADEQTVSEKDSLPLKAKWHWNKGSVQLLIFLFIGYTVWVRTGNLKSSVSVMMLCMSAYWFLHDGLINKLALRKGWFYVGKTARIDKLLGSRASAIIKIVAIIACIIAVILW